ncbi:MAG: hydroxymethylbilane synthase [Chlamydiae bacterium]|nr:hydroxymethylbilane synthase [Chlamydiota bacterium]
MKSLDEITIPIAARASELSRVQVDEVLEELRQFYPRAKFDSVWMETSGDKDLITSLRFMDKTDFFTKEIDYLILEGKVRAAIHSAKDLPDPLKDGLCCAAITKGVDSSDVLVFRDGEDFDSLMDGDKIATSSLRRSEMILELGRQFQIVDIRGTIAQRLSLLERGDVDAVVVAESALIRLKLLSKSRMKLSGPAADLQGQLAVVVNKDDEEMIRLFSCIDSRKI